MTATGSQRSAGDSPAPQHCLISTIRDLVPQPASAYIVGMIVYRPGQKRRTPQKRKPAPEIALVCLADRQGYPQNYDLKPLVRCLAGIVRLYANKVIDRKTTQTGATYAMTPYGYEVLRQNTSFRQVRAFK